MSGPRMSELDELTARTEQRAHEILRNIYGYTSFRGDQLEIIKAVLATVSSYHLENNIIISSFNPFVLLEVRRQKPNIKIGLLWTGNNSEGWFVTYNSQSKLKPYSFHANINFITQDLAERAITQGMKLFLYTVNTTVEFQKAQALHAYAIFTDYPNKFTINS